jgi:hypothetical protein
MARKAAEQHPDKKNGQGAPVDEMGFYYLPKELLMEYRAKDSEFRHAHLSLRMVGQELNALLTQHPEIAQKMAERDALTQECTNRKNALVEVHHDIERIYSVQVQNIGIDDLTGRLHQIVEGKPQFADGQPVLLRPELVPQVRTPRRVPKKSKTA